ncbi:hypothetical protein FEM41_20020 [Jejubacter calystegiae]|uniref:Uncharacterized protein n=1 Tax=Jejubacter calystegiae TaxID=2579935 RepID=A0A4V1G836_9ENTR|nr:hypothetical protein [Jejubacter calystegiae]QCT21777.1 hypothetical protein FEM41_20020 [Jejubacter calystegiae]
MTKSEIFERAWKLSRRGAKNFGGNAKQYFPEALKAVFESIKVEARINHDRREALSSKRKYTRDEAVEILGYQADYNLMMWLRTGRQYRLDAHNEQIELIQTVSALSDNAVLLNHGGGHNVYIYRD